MFLFIEFKFPDLYQYCVTLGSDGNMETRFCHETVHYLETCKTYNKTFLTDTNIIKLNKIFICTTYMGNGSIPYSYFVSEKTTHLLT